VLLTEDIGPFEVFRRIRDVAGASNSWENRGEIGRMLSCPYCVSVWAALVLFLCIYFYEPAWAILYILAASAVAALIEELR